MENVLRYVADMLFPRLCLVCGEPLNASERHVCTMCMAELPRTLYHTIDFNPMEQLFAGKVPVERATGYFYYDKSSSYASILHSIKYRNYPRLGQWMARNFAIELQASGFFDGIDCIVPVPLHSGKLAKRGYNQSDYVARGISEVAGIPVVDGLKATAGHDTQTSKGLYERLLNTQGIYAVKDKSRLEGKHVLIVDDVVTTGATLLSCATVLKEVPGVKVSIATLAVARLT